MYDCGWDIFEEVPIVIQQTQLQTQQIPSFQESTSVTKTEIGEYTVIEDTSNGAFKVLHHGKELNYLIENNIVNFLITEIVKKNTKLNRAEELLDAAQDILSDTHCYDTSTYHAINDYWNGSYED